MAKSLELLGITKTYEARVQALASIDLLVEPGERLAIVGPSGSGKSTLLRVVAGLERPEAGRVRIDGRDVTGLAPSERDLAMVFQQPAVYPFLNVYDNIAFGLRARRRGRTMIRDRVRGVAERLGLSDLLRRRPDQLSGGQRQRVAIGRAIARNPSVLLLDEPFSALDPPLRVALRAELAQLQRDEGTTTLHVTHDQAEALAFGDRVAVLLGGRLVQVGPPREVYGRPARVEVAAFLGSPPMNLIPVEVSVDRDLLTIRAPGVSFARPRGLPWLAPAEPVAPGTALLGLRPEHLAIDEGPDPVAGDAAIRIEARVERSETLGHETIVTLATGGPALQARLGADAPPPPDGSLVAVRLDLARASWFDPATGASLGPTVAC